MSWYDYLEWKNTIRQNFETNTYNAIVPLIVKFIIHGPEDANGGMVEGERDRKQLLLRDIVRYVTENKNSNQMVYDTVLEHFIVYFGEHSSVVNKLRNRMEQNMPYWYAKGIVAGKYPSPRINNVTTDNMFFENDITCVIDDFMDDIPFDCGNVLASAFIDKREVFERVLKKIPKERLSQTLSILYPKNHQYLDENLLNDITDNSPMDVIKNMNNPSEVFRYSISPMKIYNWDPDFWEGVYVYSHVIAQNPVMTYEEFIEIRTIMGGEITDDDYLQLARYSHPKMILDNVERPIDRDICLEVSCSRKLTIEDILENQDLLWDWEELSRNPVIATPENITNNPELPWQWGRWGLSVSPSLSTRFILDNFEQFDTGENVLDVSTGGYLSSSKSVTIDVLETRENDRWEYSYNCLSDNPNITLPYFAKHLDKHWNTFALLGRVKFDEDLSARAIQAWWKMRKAMNRSKALAHEVIEWYYHPDCFPAMEMRRRHFEELAMLYS